MAQAANGAAALDYIDHQPVDLVVLDVMMPGLSGLEVLARLRLTRTAAALPVIMATAKDTPADVVEALELGANDYVTKPLDFPVVLARIHTHLSLKAANDEAVKLRADLAARNAELEKAAARLRYDLQAAAKVQRAALPGPAAGRTGAGLRLGVRPVRRAGRRLLRPPPAGRRAACYLLDVSGHGVAASLLAVAIGRTLNAPPDDPDSLLTEPDGSPTPPGEVLARLSARFPFDGRSEQFFTMFYAVADGGSGRVRFASAGHPPALHVRADGVEKLIAGGLPGGVGKVYDGHELTLAPGEVVVAYSDGVTEATSPAGELFGPDRLAAALGGAKGRSPRELVDAVEAAVRAWAGGSPLRDDVSVLAVGRV